MSPRFRTRLFACLLEDRTVPASYTVTNSNDNGTGSLRQAIMSANSNSGADTIVFSTTFFNLPRTISLASDISISEAVTIVGPGSNLLTLTGNSKSRAFNVTAPDSSPVAISGMTITQCNAKTGGAILCGPCDLSLTDCIISGNSAQTGGGIDMQNYYGSLTMTGCVISGNTAVFSGGGINVDAGAALTLRNSTISGNKSQTGGGVYCRYATFLFENCTLSGNTATAWAGGAIYFAGSELIGGLTIRNSTVSGNSAALDGGGIEIAYAYAALVVQNCTVTGNTAGNAGAGIRMAGTGAVLTIESSIVSGNLAPAGPDLSSDNPVTADFCAVGSASGFSMQGANNLPFGLDLKLGPLANNSGPTMTHLLLAGSPAIDEGSNPATLVNDQRGSGFGRVAGPASDIGAVEVSTSDKPIATIGALPPVTVSGGTASTVTITFADATAINVGTLDNFDVRVTGPLGYNQLATFKNVDVNSNGTPRAAIYDIPANGGTWDYLDNGVYTVSLEANQVEDSDANTVPSGVLGKFQVLVPRLLIVNAVNDEPTDTDGKLSLREAIQLANELTPSQDTITFDSTLFGTQQSIVLTSGELKITDALTLVGPGAGLLTIHGNSGSRVMTADTTEGAAVNISGLTITGGSAAKSGGGVLNLAAALTFTNCVITNNISAANGAGIEVASASGTLKLVNSSVTNNFVTGLLSNGGGINVSAAATIVIQNSTISGNTANAGAGIRFSSGGTLTMEGSTVSGNESQTDRGGGFYMAGPTFSGTIRNSTISTNSSPAADGGGIALLNGAKLSVQNSTVALNNAGLSGGGISVVSGTLTLDSTIVANNTCSGSPDIKGNVTANSSFVGDTTGANVTGSPLTGDPMLGPLQNNGGSTFTHALLDGSPCINTGSNPAGLSYDQRGVGFIRVGGSSADIGAFEVQPSTPPAKFTGIVINGGDVQRSRVTMVRVNFDSPVNIPGTIGDAFELKRITDDATVALDGVLDAGGTFVMLTFTNGAVDGAAGNYSLADGRYVLTILADHFSGTGFDGNGNGTAENSPADDYSLASASAPNPPSNIFRIFGDSDGNGIVSQADFIAFRSAFNNGPSFTWDFNGDGNVTQAEYIQFRNRFNMTP